MPENSLPCPDLFHGAAQSAYTLPDELLKLRDVHAEILAEPWPVPPRSSWQLTQELAVATVDALHAGQPLPDPAQIEQARAQERIREDTIELLGLAQEIAARRVAACIREHANQIIAGHLAPALDKTWAAIREAVTTLHKHGDTEPRRLLSAPAKVRKASDDLDQLAETYLAIRAGRAALWNQGIRCPEDPNNRYAYLRNHDELHPSRMAMARPPWHGLNIRQTLIYFADHNAEVWMPTPDEQARVVAEVIANRNTPYKAVGF
ncbi:hypothetical protein FHU36_000284 [Nonomuraea muscovyensis]|uniref:Uncharacterized protein n=1 Tax=Nonomuraea muscovyensis TaxID=1124761 RepID=A0A7X0EWG5_9ACTN|nr:hypothetical protein [Nonomuraea muscovyensis]MBB6343775.1 hypothetical protein [Nonomuraea muscovyensis]